MDHRQTFTDVVRITLEESRFLPAVLAATEDSPLRSTPTDGGSRAIGSHSDPTPSAAMRRRRTDERRQYDATLRDIHDRILQLRKLRVKVTAVPDKIGSCRTCVRTEQVLSIPHLMCGHCLKASDRARRRSTIPFDLAAWVKERNTPLLTKATKGQQP